MTTSFSEKRLGIGLLLVITALTALSVTIFVMIESGRELTRSLETEHSRLYTLRALLDSLDNACAAQDAFMLSGNKDALFARSHALRSVQSQLDDLRAFDGPRYLQLNSQVTNTIRLLDTELTQYSNSGLQAVMQSQIPMQVLQRRHEDNDLASVMIGEGQSGIQSIREHIATNLNRLRILQIMLAIAASGSLVWFTTVMRTELRRRRTTETQLRDINAYVESLLETIPAMIFIKDAQHLRFVRINKAGEALLGIPREELIGKNDHDFFPVEQAEFFINKDREVLAQDKVMEIPEETIDTRTHGQRWLHTLKVPVMNAQGEPMLLLGISMDITTQKLAEQHIKALNAELEQKAKQLKISNNELETFCYSVSHDLRAPLRTIEGFAQLLEDNHRSLLDADAMRCLNTIRRSSRQMSQLIDDLLAYSRVGRQTITTRQLDMTQLAVKATEIAAFGRQPRPEIVIDPLPEVMGDETMISSVWLNLIDNAIKYSAKHTTPSIRISATRDDHCITYSVQDNGVGFDMQQYDKLFDVFQRLHSEREFSGTGLGLAIVERIVSRHGGRVWADSKPQQGATFYFSLPIARETTMC
ncbi:MAG TPA: ATP-binding protein [Steroidobacteraceae bacterium]|nr:ATP-binding protein [Steroidobacteraceae bacterium]